MKKVLRVRRFLIFTVLALLAGIFGLTKEIQAEDVTTTATIMYASSDWAVQYWGDSTDTRATQVEVTGYDNQYTVALDLSGTPGTGFAFLDVEILNGELAYPHSFMQIDSIKVNGEELAFEVDTNGDPVLDENGNKNSLLGNYYTSSDNGTDTRTNLFNEWVGDVKTGRSVNGGYEDLTATPLDVSGITSVSSIEVTFTLVELPIEAKIMFADAAWAVQYWGEDSDIATTAVVDDFGQYTVALDFSGLETLPVGFAFFDVEISNGEYFFPYSFMHIDSLKINDEEIAYVVDANGDAVLDENGNTQWLLGNYYTTSDNGVDTRTNLYNSWVAEVEDGRSIFSGYDDMTATPFDHTVYDSVSISSIEVTFTLQDITPTASIMYASSDWAVQYWGEEAANATNVAVTGNGEYTVSLDLSATPGNGFAFLDVEISNGEFFLPGTYMDIISVKINDTELAPQVFDENGDPVLDDDSNPTYDLENTYTSTDNGMHTRTNLYNTWVSGDIEGRTQTGEVDGITPTPIDVSSFTTVTSIEITFVLKGGKDFLLVEGEALPEGGTEAYLTVTDSSWAYGFWNNDDSNPDIVATNATVDGYGQYTVSLDFTGVSAGSLPDIAFLDVEVAGGEQYFPYNRIHIDEILIDGVAVDVGEYYTISDNGEDTRVNLYNAWTDVAEDARMLRGQIFDNLTATPIDVSGLADIETISVTFTLRQGSAPTEAPIDYVVPESFNAFMMFQDLSAAWSSFEPGVSGDATVDGDGTYVVYMRASDLENPAQATSAQVFLVDIEGLGEAMEFLGTLTENNDGALVVSDTLEVSVRVWVDGVEVDVNNGRILTGDIEGNGRLRLEFVNEWGTGTWDAPAVNKEDMNPASEIKVQFTITGTGIAGDQPTCEDNEILNDEGTCEVEVVETNTDPVITGASDFTIDFGGTADFMSGVTANDAEDGDLTSSIQVDSTGFDANTAGDYTITYTVIDSDGATATVSITVTVEQEEVLTCEDGFSLVDGECVADEPDDIDDGKTTGCFGSISATASFFIASIGLGSLLIVLRRKQL